MWDEIYLKNVQYNEYSSDDEFSKQKHGIEKKKKNETSSYDSIIRRTICFRAAFAIVAPQDGVPGKRTMQIGARSSGTARGRPTTKYKLLMRAGYCRVNFNRVLCQDQRSPVAFVYSWLAIVSLLNSPPGHYARRRRTRSRFCPRRSFPERYSYALYSFPSFFLPPQHRSFRARDRRTEDKSFWVQINLILFYSPFVLPSISSRYAFLFNDKDWSVSLFFSPIFFI